MMWILVGLLLHLAEVIGLEILRGLIVLRCLISRSIFRVARATLLIPVCEFGIGHDNHSVIVISWTWTEDDWRFCNGNGRLSSSMNGAEKETWLSFRRTDNGRTALHGGKSAGLSQLSEARATLIWTTQQRQMAALKAAWRRGNAATVRPTLGDAIGAAMCYALL